MIWVKRRRERDGKGDEDRPQHGREVDELGLEHLWYNARMRYHQKYQNEYTIMPVQQSYADRVHERHKFEMAQMIVRLMKPNQTIQLTYTTDTRIDREYPSRRGEEPQITTLRLDIKSDQPLPDPSTIVPVTV